MDDYLKTFIEAQKLPDSYQGIADRYFVPLAKDLISKQNTACNPLIIGIHGCQGSGKSTLAAFLEVYLTRKHDLSVVSLSLDDFYLTKKQRNELAQTVHPLLETRGVPGTHDVSLAVEVIEQLSSSAEETVEVPRFNKATDDRYEPSNWDHVQTPLDVIILEGWCLGVTAQDETQLKQPVNELEAEQDPDGLWRQYVNRALQTDYSRLFERVDQWVMLQAPSFDSVLRWRLEQEQKLAAANSGKSGLGIGQSIMNEQQVLDFIQYYQRLTEQGLKQLPDRVHHLFKLNELRQISSYEQPQGGQ